MHQIQAKIEEQTKLDEDRVRTFVENLSKSKLKDLEDKLGEMKQTDMANIWRNLEDLVSQISAIML